MKLFLLKLYRMRSTSRSLKVATLAVAALFTSTPSWALLCATGPNVAIPDGFGSAGSGTPAVVTIVFPPSSNQIDDLNFNLQINHTYVGDLIVTLESPAGTSITLMDRPGRPPSTYGCSGNNIDVLFDDSATNPVETACAGATPTIGGTLTPQGSLAAFIGEDIEGTWTITVTDNAGQDTGAIIPSGVCLDESTNPVTLSSFRTKSRGDRLRFDWETADESFNLGFNLWGNINGNWQQLNQRLIPSEQVNTLQPQSYRRRIHQSDYEAPIQSVGISAVSTTGQEDFFGPFNLDEAYGEAYVPRYINWNAERAKHNEAMKAAGYTLINGKWRKLSKKREARLARLEGRYKEAILEVSQDGVYKVSYEELLDAGLDFKGLPTKLMAVSQKGEPVSRIVYTDKQSANQRRFGPGSSIVFFASAPKDDDHRYLNNSRYRIGMAPELVSLAPTLAAHGASSSDGEFAASDHAVTHTAGDVNGYSFAMSGDLPWYDTEIRAFGNPAIHKVSFDNIGSLDSLSDIVLSLAMTGGIDFPNQDADNDGTPEPDHHYKVYFNRSDFPLPIYEGYAEGVSDIDTHISIPAEYVHQGSNEVEIEVIPDNGYNVDLLFFKSASISSSTESVFYSDYLSFPAKSWIHSVDDAGGYVERAYSWDDSGNFAELELSRLDDSIIVQTGLTPSTLGEPRLWFASEEGYLSPNSIHVAQETDEDLLSLEDVDYVIVSAPEMMGESLQSFANYHQSKGRRTKIISTLDIYAKYSDESTLPASIARYLKEQSEVSPFEYVLLVGGHTYNYRGFGVEESNAPYNPIPSFYRETDGLIKQMPTAVPFVDFNDDGAPDRAIGRWPVRNLTQLEDIIAKTLTWHQSGSIADSKTATVISGANESFNQFRESATRVASSLGADFDEWNLTQIHMTDLLEDDNIANGNAAAEARTRFVDATNSGSALTVFTGHASATNWGVQSLLNSAVAERFANTDKPTIMMPLACYTTYFETPNVKSLSEILLTDSPTGAVALSSPAVLSTLGAAEQMAKRILKKMSTKGLNLGQAVLESKQELHSESPSHQTMVYNWTTLGDPTIGFKLSAIQVIEPIDIPKP